LFAIKGQRPVRFSLTVAYHRLWYLWQPGHTATGGLQKIIKENKMLFISAYWTKCGRCNIWS